MVGISIILYVIFEIIQMLYLQFAIIKLGVVLRPTPIPRTLPELGTFATRQRERGDELQKMARLSAFGMLIIWPIFFIPSVLTGFGGGLILMYNFIANLSGWPYWPS